MSTTVNLSVSSIAMSETLENQVFGLTISSQDDMNNLVASFQNGAAGQFKAIGKATKTLEAASHDAVYRLLAVAYSIALVMMDQNNLKFTIKALSECNIPAARQGSNPYYPIVRLLFGEWVTRKDKSDPAGLKTETFFKKNRSAEKYAKVLRFMASKGIEPENAESYIKTFPGVMKGILEADTRMNAGTDVDEQEISRAISVLDAVTRTTLTKQECGVNDNDERKLVAVWGEIVGEKVHIRGALPIGENAIGNYRRKMAKDNLKTLLSRADEVLENSDSLEQADTAALAAELAA